MKAVLLQPHSDDLALFSAYNAIRYQPHVVTVFHSVKQEEFGVDQRERQLEDVAAIAQLGIGTPEQWPFPDDGPNRPALDERIRLLSYDYDLAIAPAPEAGAPEQHARVGQLAFDYFSEVILYTTYTAGGVRSTAGSEVEYEPDWVFRKLAALSAYRSQARTPSLVHFLEGMKEYVT